MSREIPQAVRALAGLAATFLDEARRLPSLPVRVVGLAMQATMRLQQHYAGLVARGDELFTGLRGEDEPGLATFDEELPAAAPADAARTSAFDRATEAVPDEEIVEEEIAEELAEELIAEEVALLIDDEVSGLPQDPAPEEVVEALQDITDEVVAAELALAEPGLTTEDALETALLEADGAPDTALVDGGTADTDTVDTDLIAESPTLPPAPITEDDVAAAPAPSDPGGSPVGEAAGAPDVGTDVDVLTPDGEVATVEATVTDEGIAAPEAAVEPTADDAVAGAPAQAERQDTGVDEAIGSGISDAEVRPSADVSAADAAPVTDDRDATGRGDEVVTAAGAQVDDALGAGEDTAPDEDTAPNEDTAPADTTPGPDAVAIDEGGTAVAAVTAEDTGEQDTGEQDTGEQTAETTGAEAAGAAPVAGYDSFTIAQLRGRLRGYQLSTVQDLLAYEEATRAREPYLRMLRNRLEKLERQAVEASPLAPRGL
ncbi:hypothetical protein DQ238_10410 [Geodermatophilus sp. TF02-6]|uniref:hypothetical protein n=1 Tax=Geodermatophilus sp. TF02-6 TaxID=2250575 RepID=UPI000DEAE882|nr:hypothetical protein [Geodermatophilus sp. TF02-6]RBY79593.1 hypothetical protein DQ238_10410 [Geodermatophilus sp. TF02-6]